ASISRSYRRRNQPHPCLTPTHLEKTPRKCLCESRREPVLETPGRAKKLHRMKHRSAQDRDNANPVAVTHLTLHAIAPRESRGRHPTCGASMDRDIPDGLMRRL